MNNARSQDAARHSSQIRLPTVSKVHLVGADVAVVRPGAAVLIGGAALTLAGLAALWCISYMFYPRNTVGIGVLGLLGSAAASLGLAMIVAWAKEKPFVFDRAAGTFSGCARPAGQVSGRLDTIKTIQVRSVMVEQDYPPRTLFEVSAVLAGDGPVTILRCGGQAPARRAAERLAKFLDRPVV